MSILDGLRYDESFDEIMREFADLEEPEDGLVRGPIEVTYSCNHNGTVNCIETTDKHVEFIQTGPCYACFKTKS